MAVEVRNGRVLIESSVLAPGPLHEVEYFGSRTVHLGLGKGPGPQLPPIRVPSGMALMLGDSRGNSLDGRQFGFVELDSIYARALGIYYRRDENFVWLPL